MPEHIFQTGDVVEHEKFGTGIILGNRETRKVYRKEMTFYHIYYETHNTFGYAAKLKLLHSATKESKQKAQDILLSTLTNNNNLFKPGDIVKHPKFGRGLILGNGHKRAGKIYYHVYYYKTQTYGYNATFSLVEESNEKTMKQVRQILFETVLPELQ